MAVSSKTVERIYTEIVLNIPKNESTITMDAEISALWDEISAEVEQLRSEGFGFDIPSEMPDPVTIYPVEDERSDDPTGRLDVLEKLSRLYLDK
jgi:hypothetical protein